MQKKPDFDSDTIQLPVVVSEREETVRQKFWPKVAGVLARIPFAENAIAAYYAAFDPKTPLRAKAVLLAALAYFIMPIDAIPDMLAGLGFTDDLAVLATAISFVSAHLKDHHYEKARAKLAEMKQANTEPI